MARKCIGPYKTIPAFPLLFSLSSSGGASFSPIIALENKKQFPIRLWGTLCDA